MARASATSVAQQLHCPGSLGVGLVVLLGCLQLPLQVLHLAFQLVLPLKGSILTLRNTTCTQYTLRVIAHPYLPMCIYKWMATSHLQPLDCGVLPPQLPLQAFHLSFNNGHLLQVHGIFECAGCLLLLLLVQLLDQLHCNRQQQGGHHKAWPRS